MTPADYAALMARLDRIEKRLDLAAVNHSPVVLAIHRDVDETRWRLKALSDVGLIAAAVFAVVSFLNGDMTGAAILLAPLLILGTIRAVLWFRVRLDV